MSRPALDAVPGVEATCMLFNGRWRPNAVTNGGALLALHWVTKTDDGIRATQEVGVPGPPETTYFEVHNYLTKG